MLKNGYFSYTVFCIAGFVEIPYEMNVMVSEKELERADAPGPCANYKKNFIEVENVELWRRIVGKYKGDKSSSSVFLVYLGVNPAG